MKKIVIVGAGISGLSLAYFLEKRGAEVTLLEKSNRVGGWLTTYQDETVLFELGPRGFRGKGKGSYTLQLAEELGLKVMHASPEAKKRYIALEDKLASVNFAYLAKYGGLITALLERFKKRGQESDESIASFFRRRLSDRYVQNMIYPLCQGIFAQDPEELSMKASFPQLWEAEKKYGSLTKAFFTPKKDAKIAPLSSFVGGMEALPKAIAQKLKGKIILGYNATLEDPLVREADLVVVATPKLLGFPQKSVSLTIVNMAFATHVLQKRGFGFLCRKPRGPLLGITFDSEIFPEHNRAYPTRLCAMLKGIFTEEEAKKIAYGALSTYLNIGEKPAFTLVSQAKDAIYQYPVGHKEQLAKLEATLPKSVVLTGARYYGVSVNDCIHRSYTLARDLFA